LTTVFQYKTGLLLVKGNLSCFLYTTPFVYRQAFLYVPRHYRSVHNLFTVFKLYFGVQITFRLNSYKGPISQKPWHPLFFMPMVLSCGSSFNSTWQSIPLFETNSESRSKISMEPPDTQPVPAQTRTLLFSALRYLEYISRAFATLLCF